MEIDVAAAAAEIRTLGKEADPSKGLDGFLGGMGLGWLAEQLKDLKLSELLDTLPPGVDEAVAISKVVAFLRDPAYSHFTRIVFDTAPTGHTLRLLTLPDFLDRTIGKIVRLRQKLLSVTGVVTGLFGKKQEEDPTVAKLDALKARMEEAKALFRNPDTTEFVVVTIPTIMAAAESARLATTLHQEGVPVKTLVVNQVIQEDATQTYLDTRRKDQQKALQRVQDDPNLSSLEIIISPLFDLEVRGLPALRYFGSQVWKA
jgi:arsenite-transporting ATPase